MKMDMNRVCNLTVISGIQMYHVSFFSIVYNCNLTIVALIAIQYVNTIFKSVNLIAESSLFSLKPILFLPSCHDFHKTPIIPRISSEY